MTSLPPIREKLARAQTAFFRAANSIPSEKWGDCPGVNEWSAAQLVAHLVVVERAVVTCRPADTKSTHPCTLSKTHAPAALAGGGPGDSPEITGAAG